MITPNTFPSAFLNNMTKIGPISKAVIYIKINLFLTVFLYFDPRLFPKKSPTTTKIDKNNAKMLQSYRPFD